MRFDSTRDDAIREESSLKEAPKPAVWGNKWMNVLPLTSHSSGT